MLMESFILAISIFLLAVSIFLLAGDACAFDCVSQTVCDRYGNCTVYTSCD